MSKKEDAPERTVTLTEEQFNKLLERGTSPAATAPADPYDRYLGADEMDVPAASKAAERERRQMVREGRTPPRGWTLLQHASTRSFGCYEWMSGSAGKRVMKPDLAPWIPAGTIPEFANHPDELIKIARRVLKPLTPAEQAAVLDMYLEHLGFGAYQHGKHQGVPYSRVTSVFDQQFGKRMPPSGTESAKQAIYAELRTPSFQQLNGKPYDEAKRACIYCHDLEEGEPIPVEFFELMKSTEFGESAAAPPRAVVGKPSALPDGLAAAASTSHPGDPALAELRKSYAEDGRGSSSAGKKPPSLSGVEG